jgi:hypothetical protein
MVYTPELDRQGFADRQSKKNRRPRPSINYTGRDDVRDLMKSPAGQNYGNMLDLQSQAIRQGGFDKGDSRVAELKKARRQYNRKDKYGIAGLMGYSPQEANEMYRQNSGVLREHARPTYKTMYPISDMAHAVTGSGGLTGMLLKKAFGKSKKEGKRFFDDLRTMGTDILGGIGIGGSVPRDEATEEILTNYSDKTFGPHREDIEEIEEVTDEYAGPWPHEGMPLLPREAGQPPQEERISDISEDIIQTSNLPIDPMPTPNYLDPGYFGWAHRYSDDYLPSGEHKDGEITRTIPGYTTSYVDRFAPIEEEIVEEAPPSIPFDDSNREAGIAALYGQGPMTYEEFSEELERIHQGRPHAGLR